MSVGPPSYFKEIGMYEEIQIEKKNLKLSPCRGGREKNSFFITMLNVCSFKRGKNIYIKAKKSFLR